MRTTSREPLVPTSPVVLSLADPLLCVGVCVSVCSGGIGLGLVDRFVKGGAKVIITGRREEELKKAQAKHPQQIVKYYVSDAGKEADRVKLFEQSTRDYPALNVLINNAGIARYVDQRDEVHQPWAARQQELDINLSGPIHLASLFIPHLLKQKQAAIVNNTSGLAFIPFTADPLYSVSKAGLHAYTMTLRVLLADTAVRVVEIIPPALTGTSLGGAGNKFGDSVDEYCDAAYADFACGVLESGFRRSNVMRMADRPTQHAMMMAVHEMLPPGSFSKAK